MPYAVPALGSSQRHIKPAARKAKIGDIGWHTFRHTYSTLLRAFGVDIKVQQELLRHADIGKLKRLMKPLIVSKKTKTR